MLPSTADGRIGVFHLLKYDVSHLVGGEYGSEARFCKVPPQLALQSLDSGSEVHGKDSDVL